MVKKLSRRIPCAFCGASTAGDAIGAYVEIEVTIPESDGLQRQLFVAHAGCMSAAMRNGCQIEADLLIDRAL
jgi:hypothetical protein